LLWTARYRRFRSLILRERLVCEDCGREPSLDVHHTRGLSAHPEDLTDPEHVRALCHPCHSRRTARGE
jgi:5-methylcytosine-specific restriction protein A